MVRPDSISRRLDRLEEQAGLSNRHTYSEEYEKEPWLARRRIDLQRTSVSEDTRHARDLIGLFRIQNILSEMSADELIERIVSWQPVPDAGRPRSTAEREVALAIYSQEPGTENMVCPDRWRESLEAGDELREKHTAIPDEVLAEGYMRLGSILEEGGEEELAKWRVRYEEAFGITQDLLRRAVGPDVDEITEEEHRRRISEYLADTFYGERGWRIHRRMRRLVEGEGGRYLLISAQTSKPRIPAA